MRSRTGPITLIVLGSLLALGPLWGVAGTVVGMVCAFGALQSPGPDTSEQLAGNINVSIWSTATGLIVSPIGAVLLIGGIVWLVRNNKKDTESNQAQHAIGASAPQHEG